MDRPISVLVVEDEEHIRRVLEYNLKLDGFKVYLAEDGPTALRLAQEYVPDVILLDWMMPGMDGLAVLAKLRSDNRTENIAVFMLTAKGMMGDVGRALCEGADDYITKPFDPTSLGKTIKKKLKEVVKTQSNAQASPGVNSRL
jgi:DNA-binding response OmpR family regulator